MADSRLNEIRLSTKRIFGPHKAALHVDSDPPSTAPILHSAPASTPLEDPEPSKPKTSRDETIATLSPSQSERRPIPSALTHASEVHATPLPILSMIVLSITMLGEFLSANVSAPFLLFMVEGFGEIADEADVGFWTGILTSSFFLTQFLTSLLWATIADKHSPRVVLCISLLGGAITCFLFGTSTSMNQAIVTRLLQGVFAGSIGVARGCVTVITDQSNEGRAYAILGFCWGLGGVAGAIFGATFESPAKKWPSLLGHVPFFVNYPYVLPCAVASSITLIGAFLSLFLGPDGGRREGAIRLEHERENLHSPFLMEDSVTSAKDADIGWFGFSGSKIFKKISGSVVRNLFDVGREVPTTSVQQPPVPLSATTSRMSFRTSRANGSAYGYGSYRKRLASSNNFGARRSSLASRRWWNNPLDSSQSPVGDHSELNFAQRLLMANENAVTNISDLWVSAAMNVDNEEPFPSDLDSGNGDSEFNLGMGRDRPSTSLLRPPLVVSSEHSLDHHQQSQSLHAPVSASSRHPSGSIPTIFSHSGVRTPPDIRRAEELLHQCSGELLEPIGEFTPASPREESSEKPPSLYSQLPIVIIVHFGLLALHSTTHDQVFYLYLVSKYQSGGLNLDAGSFGQLIALMCFCQIVYQFYLYPNIGPPRGRFSHLSMFRLGSMLFIPGYLSVIFYRTLAGAEDDGDFILMAALALSTAIRYCGSTFSYTAISVLLNYISPPHVVGFANGIAQSIVSFSRFLGPIIGGTLWSLSVENDPKGYPLGFMVCAGVCALAVLHSFLIR